MQSAQTGRIAAILRFLAVAMHIRATLLALAAVFGLGSVSPADDVRFAYEVRPLLAGVCFDCHGPAAAEEIPRFDRRESFAAIVVPGKRANCGGASTPMR
jgi:hypothetical protein